MLRNTSQGRSLLIDIMRIVCWRDERAMRSKREVVGSEGDGNGGESLGGGEQHD